MSKNLFLMEIHKNIVSLVAWMLIISLLIVVTMSVYPTFMNNQSKILGMLSIIPKEALQFKGISNFNDLLSAPGFYAANNIIYMMVLGSIFAIVLSSNILLKEEYNKTAEYLFTRPLTRSQIFISKLVVVLVYILVLNLFTSTVGIISIELVNKGPFNLVSFLKLSFCTFLLNLLFGAAGLFISTLIKRSKPITAFSIGLVLILYFIYTLSKITASISGLGYLSPFKFVNMEMTRPGYSIGMLNLSYFICLSLILILLSYRIYTRKDILT